MLTQNQIWYTQKIKFRDYRNDNNIGHWDASNIDLGSRLLPIG